MSLMGYQDTAHPFKFAFVNLAHWQDHSKLAPGYPEVSIDSF